LNQKIHSLWRFGPGQCNLSQNGLKTTPLMSSTTNPKPKMFFHCELDNLMHLLGVWTAL